MLLGDSCQKLPSANSCALLTSLYNSQVISFELCLACRKSHDSFFTSDDVREFTKLGYTYPELMDELKDLSPPESNAASESEPETRPESSGSSWSLLSNNTHIGRMASFLKGGDGVGGEVPRPFHRSFWCPHSRLGWCHHSPGSLSNYTGEGD